MQRVGGEEGNLRDIRELTLKEEDDIKRLQPSQVIGGISNFPNPADVPGYTANYLQVNKKRATVRLSWTLSREMTIKNYL